MGARIPLSHSKINIGKFRELLPTDYDDIVVLQYLQFGFPIGLSEDFVLSSSLKNHSSSYEFFTHIDKFLSKELLLGGVTGPFYSSPYYQILTSPLMTAPKKPFSRRAVFDASFGEFSLNLNTPERIYVGEEFEFTFPTVDDFASLIISLGPGCYMWKRDLSRFFLQLPLDPLDFDKVGCVWRGKLFHFTSFVWGCRHAGMSGQRVSSAVSVIHRAAGMSTYGTPYNVLNYSDDYCGAEKSYAHSLESFIGLSETLKTLGLDESFEKAVSPSTTITYLGIDFDSVKMEMRVGAEKCSELKSELEFWSRKTVASKQEIQSILGKLMWVSRAVKHSRAFVNQIIAELKKLKNQKDKTLLSPEIHKDLVWWFKFMETFNGVELLISSNVSFHIAGDACPMGLGSWNFEKLEYFSQRFPHKLQDPLIPIHVKEFLCVILAIKLWGSNWRGKKVVIYCDNDAVCDVVYHKKPKDLKMQSLLRDFFFGSARSTLNRY